MSVPEYYAQKTLIENGAKSLPIEIETIINIIKKYGYAVKVIEDNQDDLDGVLRAIDMYEKLHDKPGFALKIGDKKAVFYSKSVTMQMQTEVMAHELGHIVLQHVSENGVVGYSTKAGIYDEQEKEANNFMRELLAPACILKQKHYTLNDIKNNTLISDENAQKQFSQANNQTKHTSIENQLKKQFDEEPQHYRKMLSVIAAVIIIVSIFGTYQYAKYKEDYIAPTVQPSEQATAPINTQAATPEQTQNQSITVYKAATGQVYHSSPDCRYIRGKDNVLEITIEEAEKTGLRPCSNCYKKK